MFKAFYAILFGLIFSLTTFVPSASAAGGQTYTVAAGETIFGIAHKYGQEDWTELAVINGLVGPSVRPGQKLTIPTTWPQARKVVSVDLLPKYSTTYSVDRGRENAFVIQGSEAYKIQRSSHVSYGNVAGLYPSSGAGPMQVFLDSGTPVAIMEMGIVWNGIDAITYRGHSMFGHDDGNNWMLPASVFSQKQIGRFNPAEIEWTKNSRWSEDILISTTYYEKSRMLLAWKSIPHLDESGNLVIEVIDVQILELHSSSMPSVNTSSLPKDQIRDLTTVNWTAGEELIVKTYHKNVFWQPRNGPSSWQLLVMEYEGVQLTRTNGEQVTHTADKIDKISFVTRECPAGAYGIYCSSSYGHGPGDDSRWYVSPSTSPFGLHLQSHPPSTRLWWELSDRLELRLRTGEASLLTGTITEPVKKGSESFITIDDQVTPLSTSYSPPKGTKVRMYTYNRVPNPRYNPAVMALVEDDGEAGKVWLFQYQAEGLDH